MKAGQVSPIYGNIITYSMVKLELVSVSTGISGIPIN